MSKNKNLRWGHVNNNDCFWALHSVLAAIDDDYHGKIAIKIILAFYNWAGAYCKVPASIRNLLADDSRKVTHNTQRNTLLLLPMWTHFLEKFFRFSAYLELFFPAEFFSFSWTHSTIYTISSYFEAFYIEISLEKLARKALFSPLRSLN